LDAVIKREKKERRKEFSSVKKGKFGTNATIEKTLASLLAGFRCSKKREKLPLGGRAAQQEGRKKRGKFDFFIAGGKEKNLRR